MSKQAESQRIVHSVNNWTKMGYVFLGFGAITLFFAIFAFSNVFTYLTTDELNPVDSDRATIAALYVSFPIGFLSVLDYLVGGITYYVGRRSTLRERLDGLGKGLNDNFSARVLGILGAIIAFLCIALPWWTFVESGSSWRGIFDSKLTIYLYQATMTNGGVFSIANTNIWYGWVALVLVLIGSLLGIIGSLARGTHARNIVFAGGLLPILAVQVFMVGFQCELYNLPIHIFMNEIPAVGLYWSGFAFPVAMINCSLSFGFWFALIAGIIMLVATPRKNLGTKRRETHSATANMKESCE